MGGVTMTLHTREKRGTMMKRRTVVTTLLTGVAVGVSPVCNAADGWTAQDLIEPADLAKQIESGKASPIICVAFSYLYRQRHIRGSKFAGPGSKPEGLKALEEVTASLAKTSEVVLYCGCCPFVHCPNMRPAWDAMKQMGFTRVKVLNIPTNLQTDWTAKGYPSEKS